MTGASCFTTPLWAQLASEDVLKQPNVEPSRQPTRNNLYRVSMPSHITRYRETCAFFCLCHNFPSRRKSSSPPPCVSGPHKCVILIKVSIHEVQTMTRLLNHLATCLICFVLLFLIHELAIPHKSLSAPRPAPRLLFHDISIGLSLLSLPFWIVLCITFILQSRLFSFGYTFIHVRTVSRATFAQELSDRL